MYKTIKIFICINLVNSYSKEHPLSIFSVSTPLALKIRHMYNMSQIR